MLTVFTQLMTCWDQKNPPFPNLPDGRGVDIIHDIKSGHPGMRIIMITADDSIANRHKALKAGADYFIGKPFTTDAINKTIDMVMEGA